MVDITEVYTLLSKGWFTIRCKACVCCTAYIVTQRIVSMASSEIDVKNASNVNQWHS